MTQLRAVIYARYSSDLQREASIEDQVRECERLASELGWSVVAVFSDAAVSGSIEARPGLQALLSAVRAGSADVVIAEACPSSEFLGQRAASFKGGSGSSGW